VQHDEDRGASQPCECSFELQRLVHRFVNELLDVDELRTALRRVGSLRASPRAGQRATDERRHHR
jgi:hypothetical protein